MTRPVTAALLGCGLLLFVPIAAAAQSQCDPTLIAADSSGYQDRKDRCEGVYERYVSSFGVQLVGLLAASSIGDLCARDQSVHFVWQRPTSAPATQEVHLQVESLRTSLPYRLDSKRPLQTSSFRWLPEPRCNSDVRLGAAEVGILATTSIAGPPKPVDVLLPVALSTDPNAGVGPPYRAILIPGLPVTEVYVSLFHLHDGQTPTRVVPEHPLRQPPYPERIPIVVSISPADVKEAGLYRLRMTVVFENGNRETRNHYFFHGR